MKGNLKWQEHTKEHRIARLQFLIQQRKDVLVQFLKDYYLKVFDLNPDWSFGEEIAGDAMINYYYKRLERFVCQGHKKRWDEVFVHSDLMTKS